MNLFQEHQKVILGQNISCTNKEACVLAPFCELIFKCVFMQHITRCLSYEASIDIYIDILISIDISITFHRQELKQGFSEWMVMFAHGNHLQTNLLPQTSQSPSEHRIHNSAVAGTFILIQFFSKRFLSRAHKDAGKLCPFNVKLFTSRVHCSLHH